VKALPKRSKAETLISTTTISKASLFERVSDRFRSLWRRDLFRISFVIIMLIGASATFMIIFEKDSGMFNPDSDKNILIRMISSAYYAVVSLTTTGYGDMTPKTPAGRIYAIFFLLISVITISIFTATIASVLVERRLKEGRGLGDFSKHRGHFIICGWKRNMASILADIMMYNDNLKAKDLVMIANIDPELVEIIRQQNPKLADLNHLRGDYFNEAMLMRANVAKARQVFILADESVNASPSEIDSKTLMTALTINAITRNVRMCAELLDMKFERYLLNAHVDEIIYSNEYHRLILANASDTIGLSKVINDLLDEKTEARIRTIPVPLEFVGKSFYDIRIYYNERYDANCIGLIENVGSYWQYKQEAIKDAQKTPDISQLINSLHAVKTMENNHANLHPDDDYIIPKNAYAVLIMRMHKKSTG
jgi:voltage-gated potassium channel